MNPKSQIPLWKWALIVSAVLSVPVVIYLVSLGFISGTFGERRSVAEARLNVRTLCRLVVQHREQKGEWKAAGPEPKAIPKEPVAFPSNPDFQLLGFEPGEVRFQYQVEVEKDGDRVKTVRCIARGDQDQDGIPSQFFIYLNAENKEIGQLETADEME